MKKQNVKYLLSGKSIYEYYDRKEPLIRDLDFLARQGTYVFRGYSKQDQLLPNIIREKDLSKHEYYFLNEFEKYGSHYFIANNSMDFLSYAQHYGIPTRLLDLTYNPFIALSFALFASKGPNYKETEDRDYYYIRFCDLSESIVIKGFPVFHGIEFGSYESGSFSVQCRSFISELIRYIDDMNQNMFDDYSAGLLACDYQANTGKEDYARILREKIAQRRLCFMDTNQSNQRIIMQQGLFLLPYSLVSDVHLSLLESNTRVIKIHRKLRGELLEYLDTLGYNTFRLMPDLPNICAAITQRFKDRN